MINYAIIKDVDLGKMVAVVAHDYETGRLIFKTKNKYVSEILKILFEKIYYRFNEEDGIEIREEISKYDKDFLEIALPYLEKYIVIEYWEDIEGLLDDVVETVFVDKIKKK